VSSSGSFETVGVIVAIAVAWALSAAALQLAVRLSNRRSAAVARPGFWSATGILTTGVVVAWVTGRIWCEYWSRDVYGYTPETGNILWSFSPHPRWVGLTAILIEFVAAAVVFCVQLKPPGGGPAGVPYRRACAVLAIWCGMVFGAVAFVIGAVMLGRVVLGVNGVRV
jgi:hypothetical protein